MGIIFLGGVSGVGKSSVAKEIAIKLPVMALDGSSELMRHLNIPEGDYENLRNIAEVIKERAMQEIFCQISQYYRAETAVITGHFVKVLNGQIMSSYGLWYSYCAHLILIECDGSAILDRINDDQSNSKRIQRSLFNYDQSLGERISLIEDAQRASYEIMMQASKEFCVPAIRVKNPQGKLSSTVESICHLIERRS